jgi:hypothetical protein
MIWMNSMASSLLSAVSRGYALIAMLDIVRTVAME